MSSLRLVIALPLAFLLASCVVSPYSPEGRDASYQLLIHETAAAKSRLDSQEISVIYAGFALHDGSSAFQGDITAMSALTNRLAAANVQLMSSNAQGFGKKTLPNATEFDLANGITAVAMLEKTAVEKYGKAPLAIMVLSSHGAPGTIAVNIGGEARRISSSALREALKPLAPYPTLIIISSCFSGSLIADLKTDKRIIMTAASADRPSFGCQSNSDRTWFVESLANAFSPDETLRQWYSATARNVAQRETAMGYKPSQPQLWVAKGMLPYAQAKLKELAQQQPVSASAPAASSEPKAEHETPE